MSKKFKRMEQPDSFHLSGAEGWLGLGCCLEANDELDQIAPERRAHPDVLTVRYKIYAAARRKVAEQNYADAQCCLGLCYETGQGVGRDYAEAVKWYHKAAEQILPRLNIFWVTATGLAKV